MTVSVLGTGAVGGRIGEALLAEGREVVVWNRSAARAGGLVARGAVRASSATEAAAAGRLVILCLTGYAAVGEVLGEIADVLSGRAVVVVSTGSPEEAFEAAGRVTDAGAEYLDGGLQATADSLSTGAAEILYSGSRRAFDEHRATLETFAAARYLGSAPGAAAVQDLALFGLWYDAQAAYLRALDTVRSAGIDVEAFAAPAAAQLGHVVTGAKPTAREVVTRTYPRGPADLTEHVPVLERILALRDGNRLGTGGLDQVREELQRRIDRGFGHEGFTSILE